MATKELDELLPQVGSSPTAAPSVAPEPAPAAKRERVHGQESGGWVLWASMAFVAGGAALWYYSSAKRKRGAQQHEMQPIVPARRVRFDTAEPKVLKETQAPATEPRRDELVDVAREELQGGTHWDTLSRLAQSQ